MSFTVSFDATAKVITTAVAVMFLVLALATGSLVVVGVFALCFLLAWAWSPTGYSVADGLLIVHRPAGNVRIPIAGIREVRIAMADELRGSIRIFGSGGMFGYYGSFRSPKLGRSTWYVTNRAHAVLVAGDVGKLLFSPNDVDGFLAWLRPAGAQPSARFTPAAVQSSWPPAAWITALVVGAATTLAIGGLFYSPGLPAYTLTRDSLTIRDRFYPVTLNAGSIDVKNIRLIDFTSEPDWKPVERTNGFGNAHYHSGFFRVAGGAEVRLYRADSSRLILLPSKDGNDPVLLETSEPGRFLQELRQKWGS